MSKCKFVAFLFVAALILRSVARADVVLDSSVTGSPGAFSYAYEIENQSDVGILLFSLTVTGDVGVIQAPSGWLDTTSIVGPGETQVEWVSTDTPYDVPAMGSLSGFVIVSYSGPGTAPFSTFDENFSEFDGQTIGPVTSAIPEPNGLVLIALVFVAICIRHRVPGTQRSTKTLLK